MLRRTASAAKTYAMCARPCIMCGQTDSYIYIYIYICSMSAIRVQPFTACIAMYKMSCVVYILDVKCKVISQVIPMHSGAAGCDVIGVKFLRPCVQVVY